MNEGHFNDMVAGFAEAKKYRAGKKANVRVSRLAFRAIKLKPRDIRKIRTDLGLSQPEFASFLGTSTATIRSWEQGSRSPHSAALRLLAIAKERPAILLQKIA